MGSVKMAKRRGGATRIFSWGDERVRRAGVETRRWRGGASGERHAPPPRARALGFGPSPLAPSPRPSIAPPPSVAPPTLARRVPCSSRARAHAPPPPRARAPRPPPPGLRRRRRALGRRVRLGRTLLSGGEVRRRRLSREELQRRGGGRRRGGGDGRRAGSGAGGVDGAVAGSPPRSRCENGRRGAAPATRWHSERRRTAPCRRRTLRRSSEPTRCWLR